MNETTESPFISAGFMEKITQRFNFTPEERAAREAEAAERQKQDNENEIYKLFSDCKAPKRHMDRKYKMEGEWFSAKESLKPKIDEGGLIALIGTRGTGKTQMAVTLMRWFMREKLKQAVFTTAISFFMDIKQTYKPDSDDGERDVVRRYSRFPFLVIDEFGKRGNSDWENNLLFEVLNARYNEIRPTILIDNRTTAEFIQMVGPSLASRMNESGGIKEFNWESFRD